MQEYIISSLFSLILATVCFILRIDSQTVMTINLIFYFFHFLLFARVTNSSKDALKGHYLRPFYILLLGMLIVNFQNVLNVLLGYGTFGYFTRNRTLISHYMGPALYLGIISNILLCLGYTNHLASKQSKQRVTSQEEVNVMPGFVSVIFLVFSFCAFLYNIDLKSFITGASYVGSGAADRKAEVSSYFEQLLWVFLYIVLATYAYWGAANNTLRKNFRGFIQLYPILFWIIICSYLILKMFSGDRGPIIYFILAIVFAYIYYSHHRFTLKTIFIFLGCGALLMTLLNMARGGDLSLSFSDRIKESIFSYSDMEYAKSILPATQELANSVECTAYSVALIDSDINYLGWGSYDIYTIISSVPGSNTLIRLINPEFNPREYMPGEYFTKACFGENYPIGLGSTAVANEYFDGGLLFVFFLFPLFGRMFRNIDYYLLTDHRNLSFYMFLFFLVMSSRTIYICRSSFPHNIAFALYIVIVYFVLSHFLVLKRMRQLKKTSE